MIPASDLSSLAGLTVVGRDGDRIGKVRDVYASRDGSEGTFVTVTTGLFGTHASFVPLTAAEIRGDELVVPYDKDQVKHAPRLDTDEELSTPEEQRLYAHYSLAGSQGRTGTDQAMTLSEERLEVGTEQVEAGRARLRKHIVTETETRSVPISHEELVIERVPVTDGDLGVVTGARIGESEQEIVLTEQRPVVDKEVVPVERVRVGTETVTGSATVAEEVSREEIVLEEDAEVVRPDRTV